VPAINSTGLSAVGVAKWFLVVASLPMFVKAWQGLVQKKSATSSGRRTGDLLTGDAAVAYGWQALAAGLTALGIAWALWFFWQRHED
jgi:hypothetical protein